MQGGHARRTDKKRSSARAGSPAGSGFVGCFMFTPAPEPRRTARGRTPSSIQAKLFSRFLAS